MSNDRIQEHLNKKGLNFKDSESAIDFMINDYERLKKLEYEYIEFKETWSKRNIFFKHAMKKAGYLNEYKPKNDNHISYSSKKNKN